MTQIPCYRVILSSDGEVDEKTVVIRKPKIKDYEIAMGALRGRASKDAPEQLVDLIVSQELVKLLIVEIDGVKPKRVELESLDNIFSDTQFLQLMEAIKEIRGNDQEVMKPRIELVTSGS